MSAPRPIASATEVREAAARVLAMHDTLRTLDRERLVHALCTAARELASADSALGRSLREQAQRASGLSPEMVEWCLSTTLATAMPEAMFALLEAETVAGDRPATLCAVVLAGNVFTAAWRAIALPLLAGVPVIAKAATHDDVFAHHFALALRQADALVADAYCPMRFARDDDAALDALLQHAEVVSIYGDDASVSSIRARARPEARVLPHGHGLSALYLPRESLRSESVALDTAQRVALDLVAYDQRGCLSPHFALVERGSVLDARAFCQLLAREALPALERMLPRGQLTTDDKAAAMQWRAAASARGELFANETSAVSYEANLPTRESPGARLLAVHDCDGPSDLAARLSSYGEHLKCLGIAGPRAAREPIMPLFASSERPPRLCRAGEMQTPPLAAPADGLPALHGFFTRQ